MEYGENNRFRTETDPLIFLVAVILLRDAYRFAARRWAGALQPVDVVHDGETDGAIAERGCAKGLQYLLFLGILVTTFALFSPAMRYEFVGLDDEAYVSENPMTRDGFSADAMKWAWSARVVGHWAPLLWMSYMLDGTIFGPSAQGFHLTNILLHAVNAALVFALLFRWTGRRWAACWGALFWAWHPLRVESVAWITERKDVLSGLFFLLCLLAYTGGGPGISRHARRIAWTSLWLGLGLLVKPVLVTVPFVLLLLDKWPLRRGGDGGWRRALPRLILEKWPLWLIAVALGAVVWNANMVAGIPHRDMPPLGPRLLLIPGNYLTYLRQTAWPGLLAALYPRPVFSGWRCFAALVVLAAFTTAARTVIRQRPSVMVGWLWFLVMLLPSIGIVWMGTTEGAGDRFTYLPAIGLSLMVVTWPCSHVAPHRFVLVAGILSLLGVGILTARQLPVWKNSGTLFLRVLAVDPRNLQANLNYGIWLWDHGNEAAADRHFRRTLVASAQGPETIGEAGYAWVLRGRAREAQAILHPGLQAPITSILIRGAYGMACLHEGQFAAAVSNLNAAVVLDPQEREFRVELIRALFESGDMEAARQQAALLKGWPGPPIRTDADLFSFYLQRWRNGERPYAWRYFERLVAAHPDSVPLLNNLAWLAATDKEAPPESIPQSVVYARHAAELTSEDDAAVLDTLGVALAATGDFRSALVAGKKALRLAERDRNAELAKKIQRRMDTFGQRKPWRESAVGGPPRSPASTSSAPGGLWP